MTSIRFAIAVLVLASTARVLDAQAPTDTGITVVATGVGDLTLVPDRAIIFLGILTRESSAGAATRKNGALVRHLIDSLAALRGPGDTVELAAVSVGPDQTFPEGKLVGYKASGEVRVVLRRLDQLGNVIDAAFAAGATGVGNVIFHSDREDSAADEAVARAYDTAQNRARTIADAAGLRLGSLVRVTTDYVGSQAMNMVPGPQISGIQVGGYGQTPLTPADIRVTATVHATWRLATR